MDMSLATAGLDWARSVDAAMDQRSQAYQAGPATRPICGSRTEIFKQVRLECVVSLLKAAVAPVSSFIMEALALNHPLTAAIRQQLQLVPSKMVLKSINSMKPTTPTRRLLKRLSRRLLKRLLKRLSRRLSKRLSKRRVERLSEGG
ncbi:uncharacterized protein LOC111052246 [Nilaparvata lugens]|uniref:uncharacterized protein LOC111052246 n=1 Tax=Nilaparvata lugens TaxID=108931 RepID=UPI00193CDE67|nr:uncharacterized protein LOC111052246 [Nilaparvata lugens]